MTYLMELMVDILRVLHLQKLLKVWTRSALVAGWPAVLFPVTPSLHAISFWFTAMASEVELVPGPVFFIKLFSSKTLHDFNFIWLPHFLSQPHRSFTLSALPTFSLLSSFFHL